MTEEELEEAEPRLEPSSKLRQEFEPNIGSELGSSEAERFTCRWCGKSFKSLQALRGHLAHCAQRREGGGGIPLESPEEEEREELRALRLREKEARGLYAERRKKLQEMLRYKRLYEELARELDLYPSFSSNPGWPMSTPLTSTDPTLLQIGRELGELKAKLAMPPVFRNDSGNSEVLKAFQEELREMRRQYEELREELNKKDIENLKVEVQRLRSELEDSVNLKLGLKQLEIQERGVKIIESIQQGVSQKLDRILQLLIKLGMRGVEREGEFESLEGGEVEMFRGRRERRYIPKSLEEKLIDIGARYDEVTGLWIVPAEAEAALRELELEYPDLRRIVMIDSTSPDDFDGLIPEEFVEEVE